MGASSDRVRERSSTVLSDSLTTEVSSRLMSRVRRRDTLPETYVRRTLWAAVFRYRRLAGGLPGTPYLVLSGYQLAAFVHGCLWHQHSCLKSKRPASNREFWEPKFESSLNRDARVRNLLKDPGLDDDDDLGVSSRKGHCGPVSLAQGYSPGFVGIPAGFVDRPLVVGRCPPDVSELNLRWLFPVRPGRRFRSMWLSWKSRLVPRRE